MVKKPIDFAIGIEEQLYFLDERNPQIRLCNYVNGFREYLKYLMHFF